MKSFNFSFLAILFSFSLLLFAACDEETPDIVDNCATSFINQNASGVSLGEAFSLVEGSAEEDPFDNTQYQITFYDETVTADICGVFDLPENRINFSVPKQVGVYELGATTGYSITFSKVVTGSTDADIGFCGAIEITNISSTSVQGRLHAKVEADSTNNLINGNFDVLLCQ